MSWQPTRRSFLQASAATLGPWAALAQFVPARAEDAVVSPALLRFEAEYEPLVRLIEDTPREQCPAMLLEQLRGGLPCRNVLAALYLASVRAAKWHGGMHGFDHMAYVVYSAQQLSLDLPPAERLLPIFWVLDGFKVTQQVYPNAQRPGPLTAPLPSSSSAAEELRGGLDQFDPEKAQSAVVTLVRTQGMNQVGELLWPYAARDWRFIGHLAILMANSWRLLQTIGWQHAEPVMRYVAEGLSGWPRDAQDGPSSQPYPGNLERVARLGEKLPGAWAAAQGKPAVTKDILQRIRAAETNASCDLAMRCLADGQCQAGAVWDAIHLATAELLRAAGHAKRRWNSVALHANTAINALHYGFESSGVPKTRLLLTLQAVAWAGLFRGELERSQQLDPAEDITALAGLSEASVDDAIEAILAERSSDPKAAGARAFGLAQQPEGAERLFRRAGLLLATGGAADVHDLKFFVAAREDQHRVSPAYRAYLAAASVYAFRGARDPEHEVMQRVREELRKR